MRAWPTFILSAALLVLMSEAASAQLRQPRCGGWPPLRGRSGMVIGNPGEVCYGQLFDRFPPNQSLVSLAVTTPPAQGTFRMLGDRDFEYTARPGFKGTDRIVVHVEWSRNGQPVARDWTIEATTADAFEAAGGTRLKPPEGANVDRAPRGNKFLR